MMTLKRRREIVKQFKAGNSIATIVRTLNPSRNPWTGVVELDVADVIRSFMNGRFSLEPKRRRNRAT